jgi:hypothetical protein
MNWLIIFLFSFWFLFDVRADLSVESQTSKVPTTSKKQAQVIPMEATFKFFASSYSPNIPEGSFMMSGTFNNKSRELLLSGTKWIKRPLNYEMVTLKGKINDEATSFKGRVDFEGCKEFVLKRTTVENSSPFAGKWEGSYICAQGVTGLTLTLQ